MPNDIKKLEQILFSHQHTGDDFTAPLRKQDVIQLARVSISSALTTFGVDIPIKQYLKILIQWGAKSGASDDYVRFNSDSGSNYTFIDSGGTARTSQGQIDLRDGLNSALGGFSIIEISNLVSSVKPIFIHTTNRITSAATAQTFYQIFGTWVNTANSINRVDLVSSGAATYPADSSIIVWGSKE